ncbi:hypothetical protein WME76_19905 [Sorangium sp. So ce119]|uniref:hypothetical protein n=1 Tax=Sorangium sp. So ce119 TaxID=3133279 RepID=UPI003F5F9B1C
MRDFAAAAGRLRSLSLGAKLLYTAFTVASVIGLLVSWRLYGAMVQDAGSAGYYAGAAVVAPAPAPTQTAAPAEGPALDLGPELELPATPEAPRVLVEQISERKLLEVTHFHLFSVPVYVLILAHLWLLARLPSWLHTAGVVAAVVASGLHMAAPWLVRGAPGAAALMPVSGVAMLLSLGAMAVVSTVDMWLPRRSRRGDAAPPADAA